MLAPHNFGHSDYKTNPRRRQVTVAAVIGYCIVPRNGDGKLAPHSHYVGADATH